MHARSSRLMPTLAVGLVALVAACGTTVSPQQLAKPGAQLTVPGASGVRSTGGELAAPAQISPGASTSRTGGVAALTVAPGGSAALHSSNSSTASGSRVTPVGQPTTTAAMLPGVTATAIKIGVYTAQGYSNFASSLGFSVATGDQAAEARATINYLNAHGGIAGRKIVPVFHDANFAATDANSEYQAACAAWTQDTRVYAVVSPVGTVNTTLYDCLSKAGVPTVSAGESNDASFFEKYANFYYQPTDMNLRRILINNVDALSTTGFFGAHPKIGVVLGDTRNENAAVNLGLKPALAQHGLSLADTFAAPVDSSGDAAYSNAVLKFKAEGITHVLFTFLGSPLEFMVNAESQHYTPRYALHSRSSPAALLQGNAPADQQHGAMGIGWQPMQDVDTAHDPGIFSDRERLCLKLIKDAGQNTSVRVTALIGLWLCDNFFFLRDALLHAPDLSIAGLRTGAESLRQYDAASTFRSGFAPGRLHDGASEYRLFAYEDPCSCYQYISPLRPAG